MWREVLKINPKLDNGDLSKMDRQLSKRFGGIAKKFGKGLVGALTGGGIIGVGLSLVEKILNPLKETQEAIDRTLKDNDDLVTNAKQFNTESGKLLKLVALGKSTGLEADNLYMLMNKFQNTVAEAEADPNKETSVRNFVGKTDIADAFFDFIQGLQKMDKNQQLLVQQEVFGEKQTLKMADFLQTNMAEQLTKIRARPASAYSQGVDKLGALNDKTDEKEAARYLEDTLRKAAIINEGMVNSRDRQIKLDLEQENFRIANYKTLASLSVTSTRIMQAMEQGLTNLIKMTTAVESIQGAASKALSGRWWRGVGSGVYSPNGKE